MIVYLISGLGVDRRTFQHLEYPAGLTVRHLEWIPPLKKESLPQYAARLAKAIDTRIPFALVGLSFGGMVALEIARLTPVQNLILISSAAGPQELPILYRILGYLRIHRLTPASILKNANPFTFWLFGAWTRDARRLLREILSETSSSFLKWAMESILNWQGSEETPNIFRIHGTRDRILPINKSRTQAIVDGGGHLAVYTHAQEVSNALAGYFSKH